MGNRLVLVGDELQLGIVRQVRNANRLAELQLADVGNQVARDVARQTFDLDLAQHLLQNAALQLDAGGFALEHDRNAHAQNLVHGDALQVHMQQRTLDGLKLPVHDHHLGSLSIQS